MSSSEEALLRGRSFYVAPFGVGAVRMSIFTTNITRNGGSVVKAPEDGADYFLFEHNDIHKPLQAQKVRELWKKCGGMKELKSLDWMSEILSKRHWIEAEQESAEHILSLELHSTLASPSIDVQGSAKGSFPLSDDEKPDSRISKGPFTAAHEIGGGNGRSKRPKSGGPPEKYVIVLMIDPGDDFSELLKIWRQACDPGVHDHCFQRDGTMHFTLKESVLTHDEARRVRFEHAPSLPLQINLTGLFPWPQCLAARLDEGSAQEINAALAGLTGLPGQCRVSRERVHLSIYRGHARAAALKKEIPKLKRRSEEQMRNNKGCGQVVGVEIAIKVVGCDYNESTSQGEYRVLASSRGGSGGGKEGGEKGEARSKRAEPASEYSPVSSTSLLGSTIDLKDDDHVQI